MAAKALQQSSSSTEHGATAVGTTSPTADTSAPSPAADADRSNTQRKRWLSWNRLWDVLAIAVLLFVAYKWLVAPRTFQAPVQKAPYVTYAMLDGGSYALAAHRGRVVFLDFWASWCPPCKASLPLVESWARAHPNADVIAVDVGEPRVVAATYAKAHGVSHVALDPKALSSGFFQLNGFPTMVVVDPKGYIRATWTGFNPAIAVNMSNALKKLSAKT